MIWYGPWPPEYAAYCVALHFLFSSLLVLGVFYLISIIFPKLSWKILRSWDERSTRTSLLLLSLSLGSALHVLEDWYVGKF